MISDLLIALVGFTTAMLVGMTSIGGVLIVRRAWRSGWARCPRRSPAHSP